MKPGVVLTVTLALGGLSLAAASSAATPPDPLRLVQSIPLDGVEGRLDHMALDSAGQRLFLVALGNNSLEVLDLHAGSRAHSLTGFSEPQGVGFVASPPRLFVSNGGSGAVTLLDADSLRTLRTIPLGEDADNIRVDEARGRLCVGFGEGAIATLDATTGDVLTRAEVPGHPEAFQLEPGGTRMFVNVPDAGEVSVVSWAAGISIAHWKLGSAKANFAMSFDSVGVRVFVGCREPALLVALDAATGKKLSQVPIDGDVDDLYIDPRTQRLLASCGAGFIDVIEAPIAGPLRVVSRVPTAAGARTSLFDPGQSRLYLAVPHRGTQPAEVRIFEVAR